MLAHRLRFRASICPTLFRRLVFAGIAVYMGHCMGYSVATLPQQIPANTGHWPNAATEMTHSLQRWPSICLALDHWIVLCFSGMILVYDFIHFPVGSEHSCGIGALLVQRQRRCAGVV